MNSCVYDVCLIPSVPLGVCADAEAGEHGEDDTHADQEDRAVQKPGGLGFPSVGLSVGRSVKISVDPLVGQTVKASVDASIDNSTGRSVK